AAVLGSPGVVRGRRHLPRSDRGLQLPPAGRQIPGCLLLAEHPDRHAALRNGHVQARRTELVRPDKDDAPAPFGTGASSCTRQLQSLLTSSWTYAIQSVSEANCVSLALPRWFAACHFATSRMNSPCQFLSPL